MRERVFIRNRSGVVINDPDESIKYATDLNTETLWPGGYGRGSFMVRRDIVAQWAVKLAYEMIVRDGNKIIYQGRIGNLERQLSSSDSRISVPANGWGAVLVERNMHKRWADIAAVDRLEWGQTGSIQERFVVDKRDKFLNVKMCSDDTALTSTDRYWERYDQPAGETTKRVTYTYNIVSGEGIVIGLYNHSGVLEDGVDTTTATNSRDHTLTTPSTFFVIRVGPSVTDTYDGNDFATIKDLTVYSELGTIDGKSIIEDVLAAIGTEISADYSAIQNPGLSIVPFITLNDKYENGDSIIRRVESYGDAALNTWGFGVWDETGASDGKPKAFFEPRAALTDYKYGAHLADLKDFTDTESDDQLHNHLQVEYQDENNINRYRTATLTSTYEDASSKTSYGRRDHLISIGQSGPVRADYVATRYLALHKDPMPKTGFTITGTAKRKGGTPIPVGHIRAGNLFKIFDYNDGQIYWLRRTQYNADEGTSRCEPDLPPDDLAVYFAQQRAGVN